MRWTLAALATCFLALLLATPLRATAGDTDGARVTLGDAIAPLNGPWRFRVGDDPRWSSPSFDDADWATIDLTPTPGAHDGDVGLPGYVPGWAARGHPGLEGYAWYRMAVTVDGADHSPLALAGPTLVDSAYQLYVDGRLVGASGDFSGDTPTVHGVRPMVFPLPSTPGGEGRTYHVAIRVWMDRLDAGPESGGIHVAPFIGTAPAIAHLHQVQWLKTFAGYVVDGVEPVAFVVLAVIVVALAARGGGGTYRWMVAALVLLACLRVNQVLFYWTSYVSLRQYDSLVTVILRPLVLAAWTLAWRDWFGVARERGVSRSVGALTAIYIVCACLGRPWLGAPASVTTAADIVVTLTRLGFAALYVWVVGRGVMRSPCWIAGLSALAALLVGVGIFATEVNALGVPGIWFPYGVGVARGQYAYAAFIVLFFGVLLVRLSQPDPERL